MSKNKTTTKMPTGKENAEKSIKTEKLDTHGLGNTTNSSQKKNPNPPFGFVTEEVKEKMESFMKAGIGPMCSPHGKSSYERNIVQEFRT